MTEVSKEYAVALFTLARETGNETAFSEALDKVCEVLKSNSEFVDFLSSPGIPKKERCDTIEALFQSEIPEYVLYYTELVCEKGHIRRFAEFAKEYQMIYRSFMDISTADVTSAVALTEDEKTALEAKLEKIGGRKVKVEYNVDESILGGVIVKMDGRIMDGSLKRRLKDVKEVIDK